MRHSGWTLLGLAAGAFAGVACAGSITSRWDVTERTALDERFRGCDWVDDEEHDAVGWQCGLIIYTVMRAPESQSHDATVDGLARLVTQDGIFAYTSSKKPLQDLSWSGDTLSATAVIFDPPEGTILPQMIEVVASHVRDGKRVAYACVFPGIISEEVVTEATVKCLTSAKALHEATR